MDPTKTKQTYQEYVDKKSPNSPIIKNCFNAFWTRRFNMYNWANYCKYLYTKRI